MNQKEYKQLKKKIGKTGRDIANIALYEQKQCWKEFKEDLNLVYLPKPLKVFILDSIRIFIGHDYVKENYSSWQKGSKKIMLDKETLNKFVNTPVSQEQRIISFVHRQGGSCKVDIVSEKLGMIKDTLFLHVRRCNWLEHKRAHDLIIINRRGKLKREIYDNPFEANSIYDFVFSSLVKNYKLDYRTICPDVLQFCNMNGLSIGKFLENRNLFDTTKKHCKKYLESIGEFTK